MSEETQTRALRAPLWLNSLPMMPADSNRAPSVTLSLGDILQPPRLKDEPSGCWDLVLLSNYMTDLEWVLEHTGSRGSENDGEIDLSSSNSTFEAIATPVLDGRTEKFQILYGESSKDHLVAAMRQAAAKKQSRTSSGKVGVDWERSVIYTKPRLPLSYGTHHTKACILIKKQYGIRVGVFTANFIKDDWERKNQGLFVQDFPWRAQPTSTTTRGASAESALSLLQENDAVFRSELLSYFRTAGASTAFLEELAKPEYDFSSAQGRLVASCPGYHPISGPQSASPLGAFKLAPLGDLYGMERLRRVLLQEVCVQDPRKGLRSPGDARPTTGGLSTLLTWQFSSQGSLTDRFLSDLQRVMNNSKPASACGEKSQPNVSALIKPPTKTQLKRPEDVRVIFPTVQEVRHSVEGWRGGSSIPVPMKNMNEWVNERYHKFAAELPVRSGINSTNTESHVHPRSKAMPHIKSYCRMVQGIDLDASMVGGAAWWVLVTSSNLSRAAWGDYQKNNTQLGIRSYELGVLFTADTVLRGLKSPSANFSMFSPGLAEELKRSLTVVKDQTSVQPSLHGAWPVQLVSDHKSDPVFVSLPYNPARPTAYASTVLLRDGKPLVSQESRKDVPWVVDGPHRGSDVLGANIQEALGEYSHYGEGSWDAETLHFEGWKVPAEVQVKNEKGATTSVSSAQEVIIIDDDDGGGGGGAEDPETLRDLELQRAIAASLTDHSGTILSTQEEEQQQTTRSKRLREDPHVL